MYECQYSICLWVFAATVDSGNGLISHPVKGNQATAVERVECVFMAQLSCQTHYCMCQRQWLRREFKARWKLEENSSSPLQNCEPLGCPHPLYANSFYSFWQEKGSRHFRRAAVHQRISFTARKVTLTLLETTEHMSTNNPSSSSSFVVICKVYIRVEFLCI